MARNYRVEQVQAPTETQVPTLTQKPVAEFIGTAFLVYVGCGTLTAAGYLSHGAAAFRGADLLEVALASGLAISIMIYAVGHISGCHINPAVSIAFACVRRMSWSEAGAYIAAQLLGSLLGGLLIAVTFGAAAAKALGYGATDYNTLFWHMFVYFIGPIIGGVAGAFAYVYLTGLHAMEEMPYRGAEPGPGD